MYLKLSMIIEIIKILFRQALQFPYKRKYISGTYTL